MKENKKEEKVEKVEKKKNTKKQEEKVEKKKTTKKQTTSKKKGKNKDVALPCNFITVGEIEQDSIKLYIKQDVYKKIEKFAKEDTSREVGSILLGKYIDGDKKTVIISNYVEAKYTEAGAATLKFTHKTWEEVYKEKDSKYPDTVIIGWQHTHPGYGIFLSNYDMFIQENFFNLPWQVAYVVDPIANTRGFFEWKNGKVSKMQGFYIYDDLGEVIKIKDNKKVEKQKNKILNIVLIIMTLIVISLLLLNNYILRKENKNLKVNNNKIVNEYNKLKLENENLKKQK